jgi:DUF917 family protein
MADDITNGMLLEHMQGMKHELLQKISDLDRKFTGELHGSIGRLERKVDRGFDEARLHRQALQEDLEATMRMLSKHEATFARLDKTGSR